MKFDLNKQSLYELWLENKSKAFFILLLIIIIIIIIFSIKIIPNINYKSLENDVISIVKDYIKDNNLSINNQTYIDLIRLENNGYSIPQEINKQCKLGSGILVKPIDNTLEYIPYLMCDKYQSTAIATINNNESPNFKLLGDKIVFLSQTEDYLDPGYELTNEVAVEVRGNIDNKPGLYVLNYLIHEGNNITESLNRIVVVTSYSDYLEDNDLFMSLVGENGITITQGDNYTDPGAIAIDKIDGNISNKITTLNNINSNVPGSYSIKYNVSNTNGKKASIERIVNVLPKISDINITSNFTPTTSTNKEVSINVSISGNDYDKTLLPSGLFTYTKLINYKVSFNGTYTFKIYDKSGETKSKTIVINNIDRIAPAGTCTAIVLNGKTTISVNSFNNDISGYIYRTNKSSSSKIINNTYIFNYEATYANINIYDKSGNYKSITCQLTNKNTPISTIPKNPTEYTDPYVPPVSNNPGSFTKNYFMTTKYGKYGFWLYLPKDIANKKMPLVIFLHGSGECGNNLDTLTSVALPRTLKKGYQYNAIIAAPQNPPKVAWKHRISVVKDLIDYISKNYNIDPDRISITGHSSGAIGAYNFAAKYPNLLSCIAPVSGYASTDIANIAPALVSTPILAYHGERDHAVSYVADKELIDTVKSLGGNATLITLKGKGHAIGNDAYQRPDLVNWMISQKK